MALTVNIINKTVPGASFVEAVVLTLDSSYPAGGYIVNASTFGFNVLRKILFSTFTTIGGAVYQECVIPTYASDGVTLLSAAIRLIVGTTGVEVATGVNVSTVSMQFSVEGN